MITAIINVAVCAYSLLAIFVIKPKPKVKMDLYLVYALGVVLGLTLARFGTLEIEIAKRLTLMALVTGAFIVTILGLIVAMHYLDKFKLHLKNKRYKNSRF